MYNHRLRAEKKLSIAVAIVIIAMMTTMAACTTEDDGMAIEPEPVVLRASVAAPQTEPLTRGLTATTGQWTEHDQVAVAIGGEVRIYEATTENGGMFVATRGQSPFMWRASNEVKTISGWYKGSGMDEEGMHTMPTTWAVESDQNSNEGEGLQSSDFLYAPPTAVTYADRFHATITYYHQTAKVMVRIKNAGFLVDHPTAIEDVTIGDESFKIAMNGTLTVDDPETNISITWTLGSEKGYIMPYKTIPDDQTAYLQIYEALVIPQNLDFKPLLAITIGGHSYAYVPQTGQAELKPGYLNIYDIEVSEDADKIIVTPIIGGSHVWTWQQDGEVTMNDNTPAVLTVNGWKQETNPSQNVTSGIIPISISAEYWTKEGESGVNYQEGEQPDKDAEGEGWQKEGGDGTPDYEDDDQPDTTVETGPGWGKEGEDTPVTSQEGN